MKLVSFGLSQTAAFLGGWTINFDSSDVPFKISETGDKNVTVFLDALKYLFFGTPAETLGKNPNAYLKFLTDEGNFEVFSEHGTTSLRKNGNELTSDRTAVTKTISELLHLDPKKIKDTIVFNVKKESADLRLKSDDLSEAFIGSLSEELRQSVLVLGRELTHQKTAMLSASQAVIDSIPVVEESEEERLDKQLIRAAQQHTVLQNEIQRIRESLEWLLRTGVLKEEVTKLSKQLAAVNADVARFDIRKKVLEKALKADELEPDYEVLDNLRKEEKEEEKIIVELKKSLPLLSERVRTAQLAFTEADKNLTQVVTTYNQKRLSLERVQELHEDLEKSHIELKHKKDELTREQTVGRLLQEETARLKTFLSQQTIKLQLLNKKMDDLATDALLVTELDEYKRQLEQIDSEIQRGEKAEEDQKELQKKIENSKSQLLEVQNLLASLKNEELSAAGELSMKERMLMKLIGTTTIEKLSAELDDHLDRLNAMEALQGRIVLLSEGHDRFNREKATLESTKHALKLATVSLNAARQSFSDKTTVVEASQQAFSFYQEVLSLHEQRGKLINGKPCPLCGAIHHPYSAKLPFDRSPEEKLKKAKADAEEALNTVNRCEAEFNALKQKQEEIENLLSSLTEQLNEAKGEILYIAGELNIVGLREKKPITWAAVIKQKETALTNRKDDLEDRLNKIKACVSAIEMLKSKREEIARKSTAKKTEQTALEAALAQYNSYDTQLTKTKKEAEVNSTSLARLLERSFAKFGVKATSLNILKQNVPTLDKRRDQWISWSTEKKQIESESSEANEKLKQTAVSLSEQKKITDNLEARISEIQENIKHLQKERHDAIANQSPEEVAASIELERGNAQRLTDEAKQSLTAKENALAEAQRKIQEVEAHHEQTLRSIEEKFTAFNHQLSEAGFTSESSFLSSQISGTQKDELKRQNKELQDRLHSAQSQYDEKYKILEELAGKSLTSSTKEQLEEELNKKSDSFHSASALLAELREKVATNTNNKNRRKREEKEYAKLRAEAKHWEELCEAAEKHGKADKLGLELAVNFGAGYLESFVKGLKANLKPEGLVYSDSRTSGERNLRFDELNKEDRFFATLSLLLGRSELFTRQSLPYLVILQEQELGDLPNRAVRQLNELKISVGLSY